MAEPVHGPDSEQLGLEEDIERLAEIGDLIRAGHGRIEDFDLTHYEQVFVRGYLGQEEPADG